MDSTRTIELGITPAWAGKSACRYPWFCSHEDYPRVGGEENTTKRKLNARAGLPPRGRGREADSLVAFFADGITPAWAGKRQVYTKQTRLIRDYPRVGGEESA